MHAEYEQRDALLRQLGFGSYRDYLASGRWRNIRHRVIRNHNGECLLCKGHAEHVHHTCYSREVLEGKAIHKLVALCAVCHETAEYRGSGRKATLREANRFLDVARGWRDDPDHLDRDQKAELERVARLCIETKRPQYGLAPSLADKLLVQIAKGWTLNIKSFRGVLRGRLMKARKPGADGAPRVKSSAQAKKQRRAAFKAKRAAQLS